MTPSHRTEFDLGHELSALEATGFISLTCTYPEIEYLFRHALMQDAAYASLVKTDRKTLHLRAASALERLYPQRLAEFAPQLAEHYYQAGEDAQALKYLTLAGDNAYAAFANAEAIEHYRRALEIARRQAEEQAGIDEARLAQLRHLMQHLGRALELSNRYPEAVAHYAEMQTFARKHGIRALELAATMAQATAHLVTGPAQDLARGKSLIQRGEALAQELGDAEAETTIAWNLTILAMSTGQTAEAALQGERALALARMAGSPEQLAYILGDVSRVYLFVGKTREAHAALEEASAIWRRLNNPMLADTLGLTRVLRLAEGDFEETLRLTAEAGRINRAGGNAWGEALDKQIGMVHVEQGDVERGIRLLHEGITQAEAAQVGQGMFAIPVWLALGYESLGDAEQGLAFARRALTNCAARLQPAVPWARAVVARLCVANGMLEEATAIVESAEFRDTPSSNWYYARFAWSAECALALALGDAERALAVAGHAIGELRACGWRFTMLEFLMANGRALITQGRSAEAQAAFAEVRAIAEEIGARLSLWPALAALARIAAAEGDHAQAYQLRRQARQVIEYIADRIETSELLEAFLGQPEVKEVLGSGE